ncbi:MAG: hypothetical protein GY737_24765 [Desulfobacteraceae bacterium]|nr:hypothetical protein [Desulfobacteraceae bacterium]
MTDFERCISSGKSEYPTWGAANRGAKAMRRRIHKPFTVYRCEYCGSYHVGSGKTKKKKMACRMAA